MTKKNYTSRTKFMATMQNQTGFHQTRQCRHLHHENDLKIPSPTGSPIIQLLACLEKHCDLERFREMFAKANLGLKTNESVVSLSVKYILTFCGDTPVRSTAVNNLLIVCSNSPRILMSPPVLSVFDEALDSTPTSSRAYSKHIVDDASVQRYIEKILVLSLSDNKFAYLPFQSYRLLWTWGLPTQNLYIHGNFLEASSQPLITAQQLPCIKSCLTSMSR